MTLTSFHIILCRTGDGAPWPARTVVSWATTLTLDPEVQLVGDGLALGVERGARVAAAAVARHLLQYEALVAVEHARARVVRQRPLLETRSLLLKWTTNLK